MKHWATSLPPSTETIDVRLVYVCNQRLDQRLAHTELLAADQFDPGNRVHTLLCGVSQENKATRPWVRGQALDKNH